MMKEYQKQNRKSYFRLFKRILYLVFKIQVFNLGIMSITARMSKTTQLFSMVQEM